MLMPCRFPPRVWAFQLPAIATRADRANQTLPDHADRTRGEESLRSMSGFAAYAGLRTAARLGEVSDGIKTPYFALFDSAIAEASAC